MSLERNAIESGYMSADSATKSDKLVMSVFPCHRFERALTASMG